MTGPASRVNWVEIRDPTVQNGPTPSSSSQGRDHSTAVRTSTLACGFQRLTSAQNDESAINNRGSPLAPASDLETPPPVTVNRVRVVRNFTTTQSSSDHGSTVSTKRKRVEIDAQVSTPSSEAGTPGPDPDSAHHQQDDFDGSSAGNDEPGPSASSNADDKEPAPKRAKQAGRVRVFLWSPRRWSMLTPPPRTMSWSCLQISATSSLANGRAMMV